MKGVDASTAKRQAIIVRGKAFVAGHESGSVALPESLSRSIKSVSYLSEVLETSWERANGTMPVLDPQPASRASAHCDAIIA